MSHYNDGKQYALGGAGNPHPKNNLPRDPETGKTLPGPGAPKGCPRPMRDIPKTVLLALGGSFEELGGQDWLKKLGEENPRVYAQLLGRLLPSVVQTIDKEGDLAPLSININFEKPKTK